MCHSRRWVRFLTLPLVFLLFTSLNSYSQRRDSTRTERFDDLIYNERVDERPPEERVSPARQQEALLEKLDEIRDSRGQPTEDRPAQQRPAEERRPDQATSPEPGAESVSATVISGGVESDAPASVGMVGLENRPTLGLDAASPDIFVEEELLFEVRLNNPNRVPYNSLGFAIKFDPNVLEVLDLSERLPGVNIQDASAADLDLQVGPDVRGYVNEVDRTEGVIHFRASTASNQTYTNRGGVIGRFVVRALRPRGSTTLDFINIQSGGAIDTALKENPQQPMTFLRMLREDTRGQLLEEPILKYGSTIRVLSQSIYLEEQEKVEYYPTFLRAVPERKRVQVGEEFDVYVELDNPEGRLFDAVELYLKYDPRVLRALDTDEDNFITRGVNIAVGEYRQDFPIYGENRNEVNLETGEIMVSLKSYNEPLTAAGRFARIRFEAIRPVERTSLLFGFKSPGSRPTTGLFRFGEDVLARTATHRDGVYAEPFTIVGSGE